MTEAQRTSTGYCAHYRYQVIELIFESGPSEYFVPHDFTAGDVCQSLPEHERRRVDLVIADMRRFAAWRPVFVVEQQARLST